MKRWAFSSGLLLLVGGVASCGSSGAGTDPVAVDPSEPVTGDSATWSLVWQDEFDGLTLDGSKWSVQVGDGCDLGICGWGNAELQWYQESNVTVDSGVLRITAREEVAGGKSYTSARLRTLGKGDWTYARVEARARLPIGQGMWPAIWMLPTDEVYGGWAASGEIDIAVAIEVGGSLRHRHIDGIAAGRPVVIGGDQPERQHLLEQRGGERGGRGIRVVECDVVAARLFPAIRIHDAVDVDAVLARRGRRPLGPPRGDGGAGGVE